MDEHRTQRIAEAVKEELSEIISFETADPRLLPVEVTDVEVSPDGRHAHVKVSVEGGDREQSQSMAALDHAQGYLRHELATRLSLRRVPELHFERDKNPDADNRIDFLLKRAKKTRGKTEN